MKYRVLGRTGLKVSEIGFGAWAIGGSWGRQDRERLNRRAEQGDRPGRELHRHSGRLRRGQERAPDRPGAQAAQRARLRRDQDPAGQGPVASDSVTAAPQQRYSEAYIRENVEERLTNLGVDCIDVLQLHTWTRAWNADPTPLEILRKLRDEGKIRFIGISTPEPDQNSLIELMRAGWLDVVQVIYNVFEQEPAAQFLPVAEQCDVGVIVRCAFDESSLTGKLTEDTRFEEGDFRNTYFEGDRLARTVRRVERIKDALAGSGYSMPEAALKFALAPSAVSTVIPGLRNVAQVEANSRVPDLPAMSDKLLEELHEHAWQRAFWY